MQDIKIYMCVLLCTCRIFSMTTAGFNQIPKNSYKQKNKQNLKLISYLMVRCREKDKDVCSQHVSLTLCWRCSKARKIGKEEPKLSYSQRSMYVENPKKSTNYWNKCVLVAGFKVKYKETVVFLYMSNRQLQINVF